MSTQKIMRQNGRTFFWATRCLPKHEAENIAILYTFCRFVDDLVDVKGESCEQIQQDLQKKESQYTQVQAFLTMASKQKMSLEPAQVLVNTLEKDQKGKRTETWAELLRYCYGVASTVGLMMCDIFNVYHKAAYPFAIDLGIGMQLTNIARDIYADAAQDKIYLPQEAFSQPLLIEDILQEKKQKEILAVREQLLKLADLYYKSADNGMHFLPRHGRSAVLIASRLYQAKGNTMRQNPEFYLKKRADVSLPGKIYHTMRALCSLCFNRAYKEGNQTSHNASLHRDLLFLPATNPP